jgi:hypothetical protein
MHVSSGRCQLADAGAEENSSGGMAHEDALLDDVSAVGAKVQKRREQRMDAVLNIARREFRGTGADSKEANELAVFGHPLQHGTDLSTPQAVETTRSYYCAGSCGAANVRCR